MSLLCQRCHGNFANPGQVAKELLKETPATTMCWICKILERVPQEEREASAEESTDRLFLSGEQVSSFRLKDLPIKYGHTSDPIGRVLCGWHIHDDGGDDPRRFGVAVLGALDEGVVGRLGQALLLLGTEGSLGTVDGVPDEVTVTFAGARKNALGCFCRRSSIDEALRNYRFYKPSVATRASDVMEREEEEDATAAAEATTSDVHGEDEKEEEEEAAEGVLEAYESLKKELEEKIRKERENDAALSAARAMLEEMAKKNISELLTSATPTASKLRRDYNDMLKAGYIRDPDRPADREATPGDAMKALVNFHAREFPELLTQSVLEAMEEAWKRGRAHKRDDEVDNDGGGGGGSGDSSSSTTKTKTTTTTSLVSRELMNLASTGGVAEKLAAVRASVIRASQVLEGATKGKRILQRLYRQTRRKNDALSEAEKSLAIDSPPRPRSRPLPTNLAEEKETAQKTTTTTTAPKTTKNKNNSMAQGDEGTPSRRHPKRLVEVNETEYTMVKDFLDRKRMAEGDAAEASSTTTTTMAPSKIRRMVQDVFYDHLWDTDGGKATAAASPPLSSSHEWHRRSPPWHRSRRPPPPPSPSPSPSWQRTARYDDHDDHEERTRGRRDDLSQTIEEVVERCLAKKLATAQARTNAQGNSSLSRGKEEEEEEEGRGKEKEKERSAREANADGEGGNKTIRASRVTMTPSPSTITLKDLKLLG